MPRRTRVAASVEPGTLGFTDSGPDVTWVAPCTVPKPRTRRRLQRHYQRGALSDRHFAVLVPVCHCPSVLSGHRPSPIDRRAPSPLSLLDNNTVVLGASQIGITREWIPVLLEKCLAGSTLTPSEGRCREVENNPGANLSVPASAPLPRLTSGTLSMLLPEFLPLTNFPAPSFTVNTHTGLLVLKAGASRDPPL